MKPGARALGVAESYRAEVSTLAGVVVRASRVVDDVSFETCTVGGTDATDAIVSIVDALAREDIQYLLVAGIAPAWYNVLDLHRLHDETGLPVLSVTFEASEGLESALQDAFDGEELRQRLTIYRGLPDRHAVDVDGETVFVRAVGLGDERAADVVRAFTPEGGRPEPLRVARLAARGGDQFRRSLGEEESAPTSEDDP